MQPAPQGKRPAHLRRFRKSTLRTGAFRPGAELLLLGWLTANMMPLTSRLNGDNIRSCEIQARDAASRGNNIDRDQNAHDQSKNGVQHECPGNGGHVSPCSVPILMDRLRPDAFHPHHDTLARSLTSQSSFAIAAQIPPAGDKQRAALKELAQMALALPWED
jgi:hypothetical protein